MKSSVLEERFFQIENGEAIIVNAPEFHCYLSFFLQELSHFEIEKVPCKNKGFGFKNVDGASVLISKTIQVRPSRECRIEKYEYPLFTSRTPEILTGFGRYSMENKTYWFTPLPRKGVVFVTSR